MAGKGGNPILKIARENTTLRLVLVAIAVITTGIVLIGIGSAQSWWGKSIVGPTILIQLGGVLVAAVGLYITWELVGRRAFARELSSHISLNATVAEAGLVRIGNQYLADAEWDDLFRAARQIDIFVAYAEVWRKTHLTKLQDASRRRQTRMRVFLPDLNDDHLITNLSIRFNYSVDDVRQKINEAIDDYRGLTARKNAVKIFASPVDPVYSSYRFNDTIVVAMYSHSRTRTAVPVFICRRPGLLYDFFFNDLEAIEGLSQELPPPTSTGGPSP